MTKLKKKANDAAVQELLINETTGNDQRVNDPLNKTAHQSKSNYDYLHVLNWFSNKKITSKSEILNRLDILNQKVDFYR